MARVGVGVHPAILGLHTVVEIPERFLGEAAGAAVLLKSPASCYQAATDTVRIEGFDVGASPREFLEPRAETLIAATGPLT